MWSLKDTIKADNRKIEQLLDGYKASIVSQEANLDVGKAAEKRHYERSTSPAKVDVGTNQEKVKELMNNIEVSSLFCIVVGLSCHHTSLSSCS
jgi:hypothetical protein